MKSIPLPTTLRGIIPPMVTPLSDQDALDVEGMERLIEHLIGGGVSGLFILGTTGEGPSLGYSVRRELVVRACRQVFGRVPVLVGITDSAPAESVRLGRFAADVGAQGLVLAPPFYFPQDQDDFLEYTRAIVKQLPLPVFLYNMPTHTKLHLASETVRRLLDMPQIVGLKDSAPGAACFHEVRKWISRDRPEFSLLIGPEELLSECMPLGAHGGVCGGANVFPSLFVDLYQTCVRGEQARVAMLQDQVLRLATTIYAVGNTSYAPIRTIKGALACLGICGDRLASPLQSLSDLQRDQIRQTLADQQALPAGGVQRDAPARGARRVFGQAAAGLSAAATGLR
ncbi:MAG: dihydrodipicolinate synthase family protein [Tepidisphaeraceae bacterium]